MTDGYAAGFHACILALCCAVADHCERVSLESVKVAPTAALNIGKALL